MGDQQRIQMVQREGASQTLLAALVIHAGRIHRRSLTIGEDGDQLDSVVVGLGESPATTQHRPTRTKNNAAGPEVRKPAVVLLLPRAMSAASMSE